MTTVEANAARQMRRRAAASRKKAHRRALPPALRNEALELGLAIDQIYTSLVPKKVANRVRRIRQGATLEQSRSRYWPQRTLFDED